MMKVSRSEAVTALLNGKRVWTGDIFRPEAAIGVELLRAGFSRRQAAKRLTRLTYENKLLPRYAHISYWLA